jgi:hypothetical protein
VPGCRRRHYIRLGPLDAGRDSSKHATAADARDRLRRPATVLPHSIIIIGSDRP